MNDAELRQAFGSFVSGITIITSIDNDRGPAGVTVSSFCSLSLDPPMVLWCLAKDALSAETFTAAEHFVAHVLAHDQWHLAELFATRGADKFGKADWQPTAHGVPRLEGCAAWFECTRDAVHEGGDHFIVTGRVDECSVGQTEPLAYHRGRYALTHRGEQAAHLISLQSW